MNKETIKDRSERILRKAGFDFGFDPDACKDCPGYCCRGESGRIWLNQGEIFQISNFLKVNVADFIGDYLRQKDNRLSIRERFTGNDFECIFFERSRHQCSIYAVRPMQCRRFPFWDYFRNHKDQVIKECPGIVG